MEIKSDKSKSEIISVAKILLSVTDGEKDALLEALLENAYAYAVGFTGCETIPSNLLVKMMCEDFSKSNGVTKKSRAGMSEEYIDGYGKTTVAYLKSIRKIKAL